MSSLKLTQIPAAFEAVGAKHNALVDVVKTMKGENGITVVASDANVIIRGSSTTGTASGDPVDVVGSDGKLNAVVKHSTWASPTAYPQRLEIRSGSVTMSMSLDGFLFNNGTVDFEIYDTGITYTNGTDTYHVNDYGFDYSSGSITTGIGYYGVTWANGAATFRVAGAGVTFSDSSGYSWIDGAGIVISTGGSRLDLDQDGYHIRSASATASLGPNALKLTDGANVATYGITVARIADADETTQISATGFFYSGPNADQYLGDTELFIDGLLGSITVGENGLVWQDSTNKAYIDLDGFTFTNGSATGAVGPGFIYVASTTLSATYGVAKISFTDGSDSSEFSATEIKWTDSTDAWRISSTGYYFSDALILVKAGQGGVEVNDGGTNRSRMDELGFDYVSGSMTVLIDQFGVRYGDLSVSAGIGPGGLVVEDNGSRTITVDEFGIDWTDGTASWEIASGGITYGNGSVTSSLGSAGAVVNYGTNYFKVNSAGLEMGAGGPVITIPYTSISGTIQLREIDVCQNGTPKKMLVLASEPY
jgi:hypothetical protein